MTSRLMREQQRMGDRTRLRAIISPTSHHPFGMSDGEPPVAQGTPFHPRTRSLCQSHDWRHWSGFLAAGSYHDFVQPEYAAIRHAAALIDVSPLYKYRVEGPDAAAVMDRVMTHDMGRMAVGRVVYTPWCDSDGKIRQEGTVFRLREDTFQVNAAEPALRWLQHNARGWQVDIKDRSLDVAALSLQGPHARAILAGCTNADIHGLKFFHLTEAELGVTPVIISRTGYTGDLGYEIWLDATAALPVWDALMETGRPFQITPCGLAAMDISRVEAGFRLINVDFLSSEAALVEDDKLSPYELGLGWAVNLDKGPFVGREALAAERTRGGRWRVIGLQIDWEPLETLFLASQRMPDLPLIPCREPVPVFAHGERRQIGRATTRVWSTLLKKYIALATVESRFASPGTELDMEVTVQYQRKRAPARTVRTPFFRPERMRS